MKYIKKFESEEELPKSIDIDLELDQLRKLQRNKDNIKTSDYKDVNDKIHASAYTAISEIEELIEDRIKDKLFPTMMKYLDNADYEGAKWFIGRSYQDMNTLGKTMLFRSILVHQKENIEKYNL